MCMQINVIKYWSLIKYLIFVSKIYSTNGIPIQAIEERFNPNNSTKSAETHRTCLSLSCCVIVSLLSYNVFKTPENVQNRHAWTLNFTFILLKLIDKNMLICTAYMCIISETSTSYEVHFVHINDRHQSAQLCHYFKQNLSELVVRDFPLFIDSIHREVGDLRKRIMIRSWTQNDLWECCIAA